MLAAEPYAGPSRLCACLPATTGGQQQLVWQWCSPQMADGVVEVHSNALEELEQKHRAHQKRVQAIREEANHMKLRQQRRLLGQT